MGVGDAIKRIYKDSKILEPSLTEVVNAYVKYKMGGGILTAEDWINRIKPARLNITLSGKKKKILMADGGSQWDLE